VIISLLGWVALRPPSPRLPASPVQLAQRETIPSPPSPAPSAPTGIIAFDWKGSSRTPWAILDPDGKTVQRQDALPHSVSQATVPTGNYFIEVPGVPGLPRSPVTVSAASTNTVTPVVGQLQLRWDGTYAAAATISDANGHVIHQSIARPADGNLFIDVPPGRYSVAVADGSRSTASVVAGSTVAVTLSPVAPSRAAVIPAPSASENRWKLPNESLLGFAEIPAGIFLMGSNQNSDRSALRDEVPQQQISLQAFFVQKYETTVEQYRACVDDRGCHPGDPNALSGARNLPIRYVTWHDAMEYCAWLDSALRASSGTPGTLAAALRGSRDGLQWHVRLPTEAEWEKAARGTDGRTYPWGDGLDASKANYGGKHEGPEPVGSYKGASPYGLLDIAGNVWEWTLSRYEKYPYRQSDGREDTKTIKNNLTRVIRGGSFQTTDVRAARRNWGNEDERTNFTGFRIALAPAP